jgi:hypothetical protein
MLTLQGCEKWLFFAEAFENASKEAVNFELKKPSHATRT